jgi:hypothetical protein
MSIRFLLSNSLFLFFLRLTCRFSPALPTSDLDLDVDEIFSHYFDGNNACPYRCLSEISTQRRRREASCKVSRYARLPTFLVLFRDRGGKNWRRTDLVNINSRRIIFSNSCRSFVHFGQIRNSPSVLCVRASRLRTPGLAYADIEYPRDPVNSQEQIQEIPDLERRCSPQFHLLRVLHIINSVCSATVLTHVNGYFPPLVSFSHLIEMIILLDLYFIRICSFSKCTLQRPTTRRTTRSLMDYERCGFEKVLMKSRTVAIHSNCDRDLTSDLTRPCLLAR